MLGTVCHSVLLCSVSSPLDLSSSGSQTFLPLSFSARHGARHGVSSLTVHRGRKGTRRPLIQVPAHRDWLWKVQGSPGLVPGKATYHWELLLLLFVCFYFREQLKMTFFYWWCFFLTCLSNVTSGRYKCQLVYSRKNEVTQNTGKSMPLESSQFWSESMLYHLLVFLAVIAHLSHRGTNHTWLSYR